MNYVEWKRELNQLFIDLEDEEVGYFCDSKYLPVLYKQEFDPEDAYDLIMEKFEDEKHF